MTTVAWDGTILAADTLIVDAHGLYEDVRKIFPGDYGLLACAGCYAEALDLARVMATEGSDCPVYEDLSALWIRADHKGFRLITGTKTSSFLPLSRKFYALGSGRDFALMAMHLGQSAIAAVQMTSHFDRYTSATVEAYTMQDGVAQRVKDLA